MIRKKKKHKKLGTSEALALSTLSAEEILLRQRALLYLADKGQNIKTVAEKLGVTKPAIKALFKDPVFVRELEERITFIEGIDTEYVMDKSKITLVSLYEELVRKIVVENELENLSIKDLHKMILDTQKEIRLDTPGSFTSKVGVGDLTNLQDRYRKSLSGKMHRGRNKSKDIKDIKNVTPAKKETIEEDFDDEAYPDQNRGIG